MGSSSRRVLNQSTHWSVAISTASMFFQGPRRRMTSALKRSLIVSAKAASELSPRAQGTVAPVGRVSAASD